jgi:hypothetical protein
MIEITKFELCDKGALKAKVSLRIEKWGGFCIHNVAIMEKDGKRWINFPQHPVEVNGEKKWLPICTFDKPDILRKFSESVLEAVDAQHK